MNSVEVQTWEQIFEADNKTIGPYKGEEDERMRYLGCTAV